MPSDLTFGERIRAARIARGWSQPQLARKLGIAEGRGHEGLDRGSVYRWERGTRVPDYWKPWLIQVLDLDEEPEPDPQAAPDLGADHDLSGDTVASVVQLGGMDLERRQFLAATGAYALAALALPDLDAITRRTRAAASGAPVNVGHGEVLAIRQMTSVLGDAASELGGGHARHLAVRYLAQDVAPWLNGNYSEATGRDLFAATSQLVHLAGWMAGDEGNQGLAQQYYAHSFRLAAEAGDPELSATALRGMAVQAIDLGHRAAAVRLSEECVHYATSIQDPRAVAYYQATLANASALDGDRRTAREALMASESAIENAPKTPGESWAAHYSVGRWAHETGMILAQLGDLDAAQDHLHHALAIHGLDRRRTRAIVLADLGQVHLRRDDTDAALATWSDFLDTAEGIRSVKVTGAVDEMRARLHRLREIPAAQELDQRAGDSERRPSPGT
ncbi:helix-turn-helix domain-containing protein [Streptacidiphilus sp. MAP5-3]|uniref:helix-turn-helix domain-containing protein n=1 Tax=unclassified Streptacidiphilus TaxID=2643834 RepID=UPI0035141974